MTYCNLFNSLFNRISSAVAGRRAENKLTKQSKDKMPTPVLTEPGCIFRGCEASCPHFNEDIKIPVETVKLQREVYQLHYPQFANLNSNSLSCVYDKTLLTWTPGQPLPHGYFLYWCGKHWHITDSQVSATMKHIPFKTMEQFLWIPGDPLPEIGQCYWDPDSRIIHWQFFDSSVDCHIDSDKIVELLVLPANGRQLNVFNELFKQNE